MVGICNEIGIIWEADHKLWPGLFCNVWIAAGGIKNMFELRLKVGPLTGSNFGAPVHLHVKTRRAQ